MQTHNLKLPKNYRDTASDLYIKAGIVLIAILVILNLFQLFLLLKETRKSANAERISQETVTSLASLQSSLGRMDMQKAFVQLADARRQIAAALPPAPVAAPQKPPGPAPAQPAQQARAAAESKAPVAAPAQPQQQA